MSDDKGMAIAVLAGTTIATMQMYTATAPSLKDLRTADPDDALTAQLLLDADILGLIVLFVAGGGGAAILRRWYPLLMGAAGLLFVAFYYRSVYRSSNEGMM